MSALIRKIRPIRGQKTLVFFSVDRGTARPDTVVVPTLAVSATWPMLLASGPNRNRDRSGAR